ncbi:integrator complex subunit 1-like isoform X2 [Babylonia areolata]|uniref:integrator complex subunit 1-like isoform X2 n=1 Tax=Babylonia areolata TaxID=304850 RepID=UPI003FD42939
MERQKSVPGKKGKGRAQAAPPGELIALGKSATQDKPDLKRSSSPQPIGRKLMAPGSKREAPSLGGAASLLAKKPKVGSHTFTPLGRSSPAPSFSHSQPQLMAFEEAAIDVDPSELVSKALAASKEGDEEKVEGLICGAVKHLRNNRSKPDPIVYMSLMYLAKTQPSFFLSDIVTEAFCSVLKRDVAHNFKSKGNALVSVLACNILMAAFVNEDNWPDNFVKVYIDDLLGEKVWVDREDCKPFVDNILTAFPTRQPPKHLQVNIEGASTAFPFVSSGGEKNVKYSPYNTPTASPMRSMVEEDEASKSSDGGDSEKSSGVTVAGSDFPVYPRYPCQMSNIQNYVLDVIKDHFAKRQAMDVSSRSLIRLMAVTAGYGEIRSMAGQRLEMWLQNPKLQKSGHDLLLAVCCNCSLENKVDQEVILQLLKMRIKTKQNVSQYLVCIREMLRQHRDNVQLVVKTTLINELTTARNPNNMPLLNICFNHAPQAASKVLAEVFQDLLSNKDDYLRALRGLLRETVRNTRQDINFAVFCQALTVERQEPKFADMEPAHKERFVMSIADLIALSMFLSITPAVREAATRTDPKDREPLYKFRNQLAVMERDAIYWLHSVVPRMIEVKSAEYVHCLRKVLFMEAPEHYYNKDNWPPENERHFMLRLMVEAPVLEDTLLRVILIGLTRELPLMAQDCMDIVDQLIKRAALLHMDNMEVLQMTSLEMFNALMNLSTYRHPENIPLPKGYTPPQLAITSSYWKSWVILLILAAFNPTTYGDEAWKKYPILKCLMEMMMTNNYTFPPPTYASDEQAIEDARSAERQVIQQEIPKILEFESHLAGSTITQQTSHLVHQLVSLDPCGIPRTAPQNVLDSFSQLNSMYKIGQMLCRSRKPDFLLDIIQKQGTSKSMSWLAELVEASEGSLHMLPVQCLCEFLLHDPREIALPDHGDEETNKAERHRLKLRIRKHRQLLSELQELVHSSPDSTTTMFDVLTYFLQRLASSQVATRQQAIKGLSMVITQPGGGEEEPMEVEGESSQSRRNPHDWLLKHMPSLPMFPHVKAQLCEALRQACQVETDPQLINSYIIFLSLHAMDQSLHILDDLALDVSQLIVERNSVMTHILPDLPTEHSVDYDRSQEAFLLLFYTYLSKARRQEKGEYSWSNTQDQIILQWKSGEAATMHILVVHAMVIILSYGLPTDPKTQAMYRSLLEIWFPCKESMPKAFLLDTSEEALLLPDWLKLRMIRSSEPRLVEAALSELDPRQMLLFVQSFGIPVSSMSHLLLYLDAATESDPVTLMQIVQAMNDPSYISRLIHIQRMRGAQGGDKFYGLVTEGGTMPANTSEETKMEVDRQGPPTFHIKPQVKSESPVSATGLSADFFKMFSQETKPQEAMKLLQQLLKVLSTDGASAAALLQSIAQRLEAGEGKEFVQQLMKQPAKSCPVFRTFITKHVALHPTLAPVLQTMVDKAGPGSGSSLSSVIGQFLKAHTQHKAPSRRRQASLDLDSLKSQGKVDPHAFSQGVEAMSDVNRLEPLVKQLMQESLRQSTASEGISVACSMLKQSTSPGSSSFARESLLTDWLELLDPEIISDNPDLQEELVFGSRSAVCTAGKEKERKRRTPYLLALLTHQSLWSTMRRCLASILRADKLSLLDPTSVLDFVWACRQSPKIWQGRELKTTQDDISEDVFDFTTDQLLAVVDFIVLEASQHQRHSFSSDTSADAGALTSTATTVSLTKGGREGEVRGVSSRLELLLACVCDRDDRIRSIVSHVQRRGPLVSREEEDCYLELMMELYLHFPYILGWLPQSVSTSWMVSDTIHSKLDTVTHRLIGVLGKAGPGKAADNRMKDANMACRKLAARHPMLILRQLPLLAAVVGGRTQLTIGEMRHRNLLPLFVHVMGLLELLQPQVFHRQHSSLPAVLHAFFSLFRAHGKEKPAVGSLVYKMVVFLQNFVTYDPQRASALLQQYVHLLSDLSMVYPNMAELKSLLTGLTLPRQNQSDTADDVSGGESASSGGGVEPGTVSMLPQSCGVPYVQVLPVVKRMQPDTPIEDLITALSEVNNTSKRRVAILEHFGSELKGLMTHVNEHCRSTAFSLIMRYIHHCPRKADQFLSSYLNCLQHSNPEVVTSALQNLAEFTVLCQDEAPILLQKAFDVGVSTTINTAPFISETLQLLNMESILYNKQGAVVF